jgi:glycosyltransferase involved in cell wall biosynthesis
LRIAIFQDFMENAGGNERLALLTAKELGATIITAAADSKAIKAMHGENIKIRTLGKMPDNFFLKHFYACARFFLCDYSKEFDFFIFYGNRSIFAAHRHKPNLWYCSSPERSVFDLHTFYKKIFPLRQKILFGFSSFFFRFAYARIAMPNFQVIATNSENVKKKIERYLDRKATVVSPPIDTPKYKCTGFGNYWLSVNRLYPNKRIELQLEAFRMLPGERLVVVGGSTEDFSAGYAEKISQMIPENVVLKGIVSEDELIDLYANCKGFVATAIDEDFGMSVVEAMASGKAVVAVEEGGFKETVLDGKTGFLVKADAKEIADAVRIVSGNPGKYKKECIGRAGEFDGRRFMIGLKELISSRQ